MIYKTKPSIQSYDTTQGTYVHVEPFYLSTKNLKNIGIWPILKTSEIVKRLYILKISNMVFIIEELTIVWVLF